MSKPKKLKNGRWRVVARYKNIITGTWTSKTKTFDSSAEARAWQAETIANANLGKTTKSVTLGQYFSHWLELYKKPFVEEKTIKRITVDMNHALRFFTPNRHLDAITKGNYQLWLNTEAKTLSHETVRTMHHTFNAMMEAAVDEGIIIRNPCKGARFAGRVGDDPSVNKQKVLTLDEFKRLLVQIESSPNSVSKYVCLLQAFTGMRIGEALGLQWSKLDAESHTITVDGQYDYSLTKSRIHLKDHTAPRQIVVEPILFDYLNEYRKWHQRQLRHEHIVYFNVNSYCFAEVTANSALPITPTAVNKFLANQCKKIGITRISSHGWRRTQATLMTYAQIDPKFIASFLGHTVDTLQKYYVFETDDLRKKSQQMRTNFMESKVLGD